MENGIIIAVVAAIVYGIIRYLYKAKKRGQHCIGCPYSKECSGKCNSNSCTCDNQNKD